MQNKGTDTRWQEKRDVAGIRAYYDQTWSDYRIFWLNPSNRAIHFGYWDESTHTHAESLDKINRVMAERITLRAGERVLDAGCGVGGTAMWLAQQYRVHVVGIALPATQIARARRYANERGIEQLVEFEQQDFRHTTFPPASFDVLWAQESVCHAPDKREFVAEAFRLLKPGGRLIVLEYFRFKRPFALKDEQLLKSWLSGWAIPDLGTPGEFAQWAREAGFGSVKLENIESHIRPSHRRLYLITMLMYPGAALLRLLRLRSEVQHGNLRGARDQWRALNRGLWFEGILTARKPC